MPRLDPPRNARHGVIICRARGPITIRSFRTNLDLEPTHDEPIARQPLKHHAHLSRLHRLTSDRKNISLHYIETMLTPTAISVYGRVRYIFETLLQFLPPGWLRD